MQIEQTNTRPYLNTEQIDYTVGTVTVTALVPDNGGRDGKVTVTDSTVGTYDLLGFHHPNPRGAAKAIATLVANAATPKHPDQVRIVVSNYPNLDHGFLLETSAALVGPDVKVVGPGLYLRRPAWPTEHDLPLGTTVEV